MHTNRPDTGIDPFYFGTAGKPLFGIYHAPQFAPPRDCGVVFCHPMGWEYIYSHRALRQLAIRLATAGFPVLRFDFYGCGDSSGNCEQGQIDQWLTDLSSAVEKIRRRGPLLHICLVGLRLGGTLAVMAGASRGDIDGLVLWDVVANGQAYLEELRAFADRMRRRIDDPQAGIWGATLTPGMRTDLNNIDLLTMAQKPANHILLIDSHQEAGAERLQAHFAKMGILIEAQHLPGEPVWRWTRRAIVPVQMLQAVVRWISEVYP